MADTLNRSSIPDTPNPRLVRALEANWQEEMEGAATYHGLAAHETDPARKQSLLEMAESEVQHAERWAGRLHELGQPTPTYNGPATGQADTLANRIGGPDSALRRVELEERRHVSEYGRQLRNLGDAQSVQISGRPDRGRAGALADPAPPGPALARRAAAPPVRPNAAGPRQGAGRDARPSGAASHRRRGSATPFTASTTAWARSSASSRASPARPSPTRTAHIWFCWRDSPA